MNAIRRACRCAMGAAAQHHRPGGLRRREAFVPSTGKALGLLLVLVTAACESSGPTSVEDVREVDHAVQHTHLLEEARLVAQENPATLQHSFLALDCAGQTDRPHKSVHVPGTVNVVGRTTCFGSVPFMSIAIRLDIQKCFLGICWWKYVSSASNTKTSWGTVVRANTAGPCVSGEYRGTSSHRAIDGAGVEWTAYTRNGYYIQCTPPLPPPVGGPEPGSCDPILSIQSVESPETCISGGGGESDDLDPFIDDLCFDYALSPGQWDVYVDGEYAFTITC